MKITITYDNGRVDVFDDTRFTAAQPFGNNTMLANYELRFDQLGETGPWMRVHRYDINSDSAPKDPIDGIPKASRNRGWQFLLAEREEIGHIVQIKTDEKELAFRIGGELVDAAKFKQMVDLCINDSSKKSKAQCAIELFQTLSKMPGASVAEPESIVSRFGFGMQAFDAALHISAAVPQKSSEQGAGGGKGKTEASRGWMEDLDNEDLVKVIALFFRWLFRAVSRFM